MNRVFAAAVVACAVLTGGCTGQADVGGGGGGGGGTPASAVSGVASASRPPVLSRVLGEYAGFGSSCQSHTDPGCTLRFTVTKVSECAAGVSPGGPPPPGTRRKVVWLEVATGPGFTDSAESQDLVTQFTSVDSRGVTSGTIRADSMGPCVPRHQRIGPPLDHWQPGKKYAGGVEVFLPDGAAKIVNGRNTVEWSLP
ncbi:hypothetical protein JOF56_005705 [Kibdelosporangium banguiense]|uniref:Lipoprotein n=1 Tax=Kibdelosporangium banguiense TaxID=1365924 RepID=A0ABS4TLP7_9PSEU|nr:hypothetical protein [Kibdelosporangium banguiense]MBP2325320.1 hypothetical protein [Kibdelosporangium banguiense]